MINRSIGTAARAGCKPCRRVTVVYNAHRRSPRTSMLKTAATEFLIAPDPDDPRLVRPVPGIDQDGKAVEQFVVTERPLTIFLNAREIVTAMTIGDHPDW